MAVVPGEVWVTANFKESQVGKIRPGQTAEITIDAYSDKTFKAHVDSIQAGTGPGGWEPIEPPLTFGKFLEAYLAASESLRNGNHGARVGQ